MLFICNTMPAITNTSKLGIKAIDSATVVKKLKEGSYVSLITEKGLANVLTSFLNMPVPTKVIELTPRVGQDSIILVQAIGNIKDSDTTLPRDVTLQFSIVEVEKQEVKSTFRNALRDWIMKD